MTWARGTVSASRSFARRALRPPRRASRHELAGVGYGLATVAAVAMAASGTRLAAQDIETVARMRGRALPAAYYERVRRDPDAFELPNGFFGRRDGPVVVADEVTGAARLPVILALFQDSPDPHISVEDVRASLFTGPAAAGTMTEFYEELSGGRFRVEGDVHAWVRTSLTMDQVVGDTYGLGDAARVDEYLLEALAANDPTVDFGLYDNDGPDGVPNSGDDDGFVDVMTFEFLEIAASCGGPAVWPHRSGISNRTGGSPYRTDDPRPDGSPVLVDGYIIQSVADCGGQDVQTASTIAHEFGHALGLPDYYHPIDAITPENRRWVLGCWGLMAAGSWGCGPVSDRVPFGPTHMVAYNKERLGWASFEVVGSVRDTEFVLEPIQTSGRALMIPLDDANSEALLVEYRDQVGFDRAIPAAGVLIHHRDVNGQLRPRTGFRYFLRTLEADGNAGLLRTAGLGGNRGEPGDVWGVAGAVGPLHALTDPALRLNATGSSTPVNVHAIEVRDGRAHVRLTTARTPRVPTPLETVTVAAAEPVEVRLTVNGGYMPYVLESGLGAGMPGLELTADGEQVVVGGAPWRTGDVQVGLRVVDARGSAFDFVLPMSVGALQVAWTDVVAHVLGEDRLTEAQRGALDEAGNGNGRLDVGDARARLIGN